MDDFRLRLANRFRKQEKFAADYAPMYSRLFGLAAQWLETRPEDPLVLWLLETGSERPTLDVTLLLPAALHRQVLAGSPAAAELARYFPTATPMPISPNDSRLEQTLYDTIWSLRDELRPFIEKASVQTNETARGLCWLLPAVVASWPAIELVELGASAGLNLVAEQRAYRLISEEGASSVDYGPAPPVQFSVSLSGEGIMPDTIEPLPEIVLRAGGDRAPFLLNTVEDELTLASFVWADQPARMDRLREGIAALRDVGETAVPVQLYDLQLPGGLPNFLEATGAGKNGLPVIVYNTAVAIYLREQRPDLISMMDAWAGQQNVPVLWLQWEWPMPGEEEPPQSDFLGWTADLWVDSRHIHWDLAWAHPHGTRVMWRPDWSEFLRHMQS